QPGQEVDLVTGAGGPYRERPGRLSAVVAVGGSLPGQVRVEVNGPFAPNGRHFQHRRCPGNDLGDRVEADGAVLMKGRGDPVTGVDADVGQEDGHLSDVRGGPTGKIWSRL